MSEDPLVGDDVTTLGMRPQVPSVVGEESRVLLHSVAPAWIGERATDGGGYGETTVEVDAEDAGTAAESTGRSTGRSVPEAWRVTIEWTWRGSRWRN